MVNRLKIAAHLRRARSRTAMGRERAAIVGRELL
jgi:hypothetical protein